MSERVGPYRLLKRIGTGGMGEVWEAEPDAGGPHIALKLMRGDSHGEKNTLRKFLAEARIGQQLKHRNIVQVLDAGMVGDRAFIAMELLEGFTLSTLISQPGPALPIPLVLSIARQALSGLEAAHALIVHRDLKPSNLFLTKDGVLKLIDFGIATWGDLERTRTATGMMRGSLPYSTPEQARNEPVDARSDLFSLGLVLHELVTGERVLHQNSDAAIVTALLMVPAPALSSVRADVPPALEDAVAWALQKDKEKRPASAAALLAALPESGAWGEADVALWVSRRMQHAGPVTSTNPVPAPIEVPRPVKKRSAVPWVIGAAVVALLGAGVSRFVVAPPPELPVPKPVVVAAEILPPVADASVEVAVVPPPVVDAGAPTPALRNRPVKADDPKRTAPAWITVDAQPTWGTVFVDGKKIGPTPLYRYSMPSGRHQIEVVKDDGTRKKRKIALQPGGDAQVVFTW